MDFQLTSEQQMFKDGARRFLEDNCAFDARGPVIGNGSFDRGHWDSYAELGWLGMSIPEEYGGLGGSVVETAILMEEFGRVLAVEPYWPVAVLAAQTLLASGDQASAQALLPALIAGVALPVLAHGEPEARGLVEYVSTSATAAGQGRWKLNGHKSLVIGGNIADTLLVSARTGGALADRAGISLFKVRPGAPGVIAHGTRLIDNRWCIDLTLTNVEVTSAELVGASGAAFAALETGHAHGLLALCAEAVGVMEKALWITRDYLKLRSQFGAKLSSFQTLQHRMSEMLIELELSRSMVHKGLAAMDGTPQQRSNALSAAKVQIGSSGKFVCGQAIQLHGGIGVTEEYLIGHYFKRMTTIELALGTSHFHLERLADQERRRAA